LSEPDLRALAKNQAQLDVAGRIGLVSNLWAQVRAGALAPGVLLDVLPAFDRETDSHVMRQIVATLDAVDRALIDDRDRMAFRTYVATRLWRAKERLGSEPKGGEADDLALTRTAVLETMGWVAREPSTLRDAGKLAASWLQDPGSVDPDVASIAVPLASLHAGPARLDELRKALKAAKSPQERMIALTAIGTFADEATLTRAWDLALTSEIRQEDAMHLFAVATERAERARLFFPWLQAHWDAAKAIAPAGYQQGLVALMATACSKDQKDAIQAFLAPRAKELEGAVRPLAENAEEAAACIALRAQGADAVATYFKKGTAR
jgi:alanyl aminopeptidase